MSTTQNSQRVYNIQFYSDDIHTVVTHHPQAVADWISTTESLYYGRVHHLIVGLDVEWRPNFSRYNRNPVTTLQLCVGRRCLIFQILHYSSVFNSHGVLDELAEFLGKEEYTFAGVGIGADVENLGEDYGVRVGGRIVDLRGLAVEAYQRDGLRNSGLKELANVVLGREVKKPREITLGEWDSRRLTDDQVMCACIDAYASFELVRDCILPIRVSICRN